MVVLYCLALGGALLAPPAASATCTDGNMIQRLSLDAGVPDPALQQEVWRIVDWVRACSKTPTADEQVLYTWGHQKKLRRMLNSDRLSFYAYDRSRQLTYNQLQAYKVLSTLDNDPIRAIAEARTLLRDPAMHNLLELARVVESTPTTHTERRDALLLAMYEQWLPGFLDLASLPPGDRLQWVLNRLKARKDTLQFHEAQGIQDALLQFDAREKGPGSSNFLSSSSLGWGVSFSTSAVDFLNHFYDENHMGLACRTPANQRRIMLNVDNTQLQQAFKAAKIFVPDGTRGLPLLNNTLYVRPAAFEEAGKGHIVVSRAGANVGLVYTEKAVLDYSQACQAITVENFPCRDWDALLKHPLYVKGANGPGLIQRYLEQERSAAGPNLPFSQRVQQKTDRCRRQARGAGS